MYADKNFYLSGAPATTLSGAGTPQTLTATAASTNVYDFGGTTTIGQADGEDALYVEVLLPAAATGTSPTLTIAIQDSSDNSSFTDLCVSRQFTGAADMAAANVGTLFRFAVPPSAKRYIRLNYTVGGTTPSIGVYAILKAYI